MNVKLACPKCRAVLDLPLAQMTDGGAVACTACGELIRFKGADTAKAQRTLDELQANSAARTSRST